MERDAISALVDCAVPEKLEAFQQVLLQFVNQHLGKLNLVVTNLESQVGWLDQSVNFVISYQCALGKRPGPGGI